MQETIPTNKKAYECKRCGNKFGQRNHLKLHERIHAKSFQCNICGRKFTKSSYLKSHEMTHTGKINYHCDTRGKKFGSSSTLKLRKSIRTLEKTNKYGVKSKNYSKLHEKTPSENSFKHNIYDKTFNYNNDMSIDQRIQSTNNPYECHICGKKFRVGSKLKSHKSMLQILKAHERIHAGEKSNENIMCGNNKLFHKINASNESANNVRMLWKKNFLENYHLKLYQRLHSNENSCENGMKSKQTTNLKLRANKKDVKCSVCEKKFTCTKNLKVHLRLHTGEKPFECKVCEQKFMYRYKLKSHECISSIEKTHKCNICGKKFAYIINLQLHEKDHVIDAEKHYTCNVCGKKFIPQSSNLKFCEKNCTDEKLHKCESCRNKLVSASHIEKDHVVYAKQLYECNVCEKIFTPPSNDLKSCEKNDANEKPPECESCQNRSMLKKGESIHTDEKSYECKLCGNKFTWSQILKRHQKSSIDVKSYECNECRKENVLNSHSESHEKNHTSIKKSQECQSCGNKFKVRNRLKEHERIHPDEKPYECKLCGNKYTWSQILTMPIIIHTNDECNAYGKKFAINNRLKPHKKNRTNKKICECQSCGIKSKVGNRLKVQERTHTNENPYECNLCGNKFTLSQILKMHQRSGNDQKPHECNERGKENALSNHLGKSLAKNCTSKISRKCQSCGLKKQEIIDTDRKPYECKLCGNKLTWNQILKMHETIHSKNEV